MPQAAMQHQRSRYTIRTVMFEDGERTPILVDARRGLPLFDPCVYVSTEIRPKTGSAATIEQALRGVQFLLTFVADRQIDLSERFSAGRFLDLHELDDLVRAAYLPFGKAALQAGNPQPVNPKVVSFDKVRKRAPKVKEGATVAVSTVAIRLYYASAYLEWMGHRAARQVSKTLEEKNNYMALLREFLGRLRSRTPSSRASPSRLSLNADQKAELLRIIEPGCPDNPWNGAFVRDRNRLIVLWGLGTGLRRGELLGLRIKLLNLRQHTADIIRRPDDKNDPRKYQPNTKTRERAIGISEELAYWTHEHIVKRRSMVRGARKHDFLFVSEHTGRPLSLAALSKIFRSLRERQPAVGEALTSHVLRHTWNEDFSDIAEKAGLAPTDERRARNHAMGWSDLSKSSDHYLRRRTRKLSTEASVRIQQSVIREATRSQKYE
ncbi:tyrosine-type recombinase/integrase [Cupriavidus necator]|uniref:tyrosine-type recombinase/integrase n=1 Tax=Cupriavidus necator TaxID=106590 RepID=UPI0039C3C440